MMSGTGETILNEIIRFHKEIPEIPFEIKDYVPPDISYFEKSKPLWKIIIAIFNAHLAITRLYKTPGIRIAVKVPFRIKLQTFDEYLKAIAVDASYNYEKAARLEMEIKINECIDYINKNQLNDTIIKTALTTAIKLFRKRKSASKPWHENQAINYLCGWLQITNFNHEKETNINIIINTMKEIL